MNVTVQVILSFTNLLSLCESLYIERHILCVYIC